MFLQVRACPDRLDRRMRLAMGGFEVAIDPTRPGKPGPTVGAEMPNRADPPTMAGYVFDASGG